MVHVVSCHHFVSQDVFVSEKEPVAFCSAQGKLLIATQQNVINVHDVDSRGNILHSFPTTGHVEQLVYSDVGNYIATLEKTKLAENESSCSARIYFNWWIESRRQPMKTRVAGSFASSPQNCSDHFEVVELPLTANALCISCCKKTATLVVSVGKTVSMFCYSVKGDENSDHCQSNFSHFVDIEVNFIVKELSIYEGYLACMSKHQLRILKISIEKEETNLSSHHLVNNGNADNKSQENNVIEWRFESCTSDGLVDGEWERNLRGRIHENSFPITIMLRGIEKQNELELPPEDCEIYGPCLSIKGHKAKVKPDSKVFELWPSLTSTNINAVTLFYREFAFTGEKPEQLSSLQLVAFYESDKFEEKLTDPLHTVVKASDISQFSLQWSPFNSTSLTSLKAMGCFFSTSHQGFLYDVMRKPKEIGSYQYTAPLKSAVLDSTLLHALTDAGLETYTAHLSRCAVCYAEKPDSITNICPDIKAPICLLGLCPFLGVNHLNMSETHLMLISSADINGTTSGSSEGNGSTIYVLKKPSPQQIFSDLLEAGQLCKSTSQSTYQIVLTEGHMMLRTHLLFSKKPDSEVEELYRKSCILLGDYFACSGIADEKLQASPYYRLSQLSLDDVIQRILNFQNQKHKHGNVLKSIVPYLNSILLDKHSCNAQTISKSVAESILDIYMEEEPESLWKIILCSGLSSYRPEKAMLLLKKRITGKRHLVTSSGISADTVAISSLLLKKGNSDAAQNMLLSLAKTELANVLKEIWSLLCLSNELSSFGKFVMRTRPDAFIEVLLSSIEGKIITVENVIDMLKKEEPQYDIYHVPLLKEFLEAVYTYLNGKGVPMDIEWLILLIQLYLNRLLESEEISFSTGGHSLSSLKSSTSFGQRPPWLNEFPPFNGNAVSSKCLTHEPNSADKSKGGPCLCYTCNENLLKLQSLLYQKRTVAIICEEVLAFLSPKDRKMKGRLSVEVLCLNEKDAVIKMLNDCPAALFPYAEDMFGTNDEKWCVLFSTLQQKLSSISTESSDTALFTQTLHRVLQHLAEILELPVLLSLLPAEPEPTFEPYLKRCYEKHKSKQLRNKIIALGNEIKGLM